MAHEGRPPWLEWRLLEACSTCSLHVDPHINTRRPAFAQGPLEHVYRAALALGTANQLTNILRDVGEDASQRNRIYVPLDELAAFKIREEEVRQRSHSQACSQAFFCFKTFELHVLTLRWFPG